MKLSIAALQLAVLAHRGGASSSTTTTAFTLSAPATPPFLGRSSSAVVPRDLARLQMSTEIDSDAVVKTGTSNPEGEPHEDFPPLSTPFAAGRDQVVAAFRNAVETHSMEEPLIYFIDEYFRACDESSKAGNDFVTPKLAGERVLKAIELGMEYGLGNDVYAFGVQHSALRGRNPEEEDGNEFDYYEWGCDFFRPVMDYSNSVVLGEENAKEAFDRVAKGENVVFLANHQSEADPQVFSTLLETIGYGEEAAEVTYVAGHKVTTDPLAIPFSMGRNLLCIHSKKHIDAEPDKTAIKKRQNLTAMNAMLRMFKQGGATMWVAPSGGRDRRDTETGHVPPAKFDQKTIDMFRLMGTKSKVPTHFYPLAIVSYELCPPPDHVEAGVGEQRNIRFEPVGIAVGKEVPNVGGVESRHLFTERAEKECFEDYETLLTAVEERKKESKSKSD